jgi:hypothetical protein
MGFADASPADVGVISAEANTASGIARVPDVAVPYRRVVCGRGAVVLVTKGVGEHEWIGRREGDAEEADGGEIMRVAGEVFVAEGRQVPACYHGFLGRG